MDQVGSATGGVALMGMRKAHKRFEEHGGTFSLNFTERAISGSSCEFFTLNTSARIRFLRIFMSRVENAHKPRHENMPERQIPCLGSHAL
jgi:hypothetical protein